MSTGSTSVTKRRQEDIKTCRLETGTLNISSVKQCEVFIFSDIVIKLELGSHSSDEEQLQLICRLIF